MIGKAKKKIHHKLLIQIGILLTLIFSLSVFVNIYAIYGGSVKMYLQAKNDMISADLEQYTFSLGEHYRQLLLGYSFNHSNRREQESIYRLDRLANADSSFSKPIDLLPSVTEYQQVFDRANSHLAHYIDNTSAFWADFKYGLGQKAWGQFYLES